MQFMKSVGWTIVCSLGYLGVPSVSANVASLPWAGVAADDFNGRGAPIDDSDPLIPTLDWGVPLDRGDWNQLVAVTPAPEGASSDVAVS